MAATPPSASRSPRQPAPKSTLPPVQAHVTAPVVDPEYRRSLIAQLAYFRAQRRGFEPGHEQEDWLTAEAEVDAALMLGVMS